MSLTGLLDVLLDPDRSDPALAVAVEAAREGTRDSLDVTVDNKFVVRDWRECPVGLSDC